MSRAEQKDQTRQRILTAAKDAFDKGGYERTTLRHIAETAGIATGTIFVHFQDKQDLLHAALFEDLEKTLKAVLSAPPGDSLEGWLEHLTDSALAYYESRPALSRVLLKESLLADLPWSERFAAQLAELHAGVASRVDMSKQHGEVRASLDTQVFAAAYVSFYMFALIAWAQGAHPDVRSMVKHLVAQHLVGFKREGAS